MKDTVTAYQFVNEMAQAQHGFSREGARALFEYFEAYEEDTGEQMEFDPVAFRCSFHEYESLKEVQESYPDIKTIEDLHDRTTVIKVPSTDRLIVEMY